MGSFFPTFLWGSNCFDVPLPAMPACCALPSRKHFGCALVRFKIALSLGASSKNRRSMLIFAQKIGDFAFKVVSAEGSRTVLVPALFEQNCAPVLDILKIPGFACS